MSETTATDGRALGSPHVHRPARWLWQVPVFVVGMAALTVVGLTRLPWNGWQPAGAERELIQARRLLEESNWDFDKLVALTSPGLAQEDKNPSLAAQAHFVLGSAYLLQADRPGTGAPTVHLRQARTHLERANQLGVPQEDRSKLAYRLGKVYFRQNEDPKLVLEKLVATVDEAADDPADGYFMLAQTYLRLPEKEQDFEAALAANTKLLELPIENDVLLAPGRLQRGDLLLRLHKPEPAREALERVSKQASPDIVAQARYLLAWSYQQESQWTKASDLWQESLAEKKVAPQHPELIFYNLGICQRQLDHYKEAGQSWENCIHAGPGSEAASAAALLLGDLRLGKLALEDKGQARKAIDSYALALQTISDASQWNNSLLSLARCRSAFDSACHILRETGQYELSIELAGQYEKIAANGRAMELRGEAAHFWALAQEDQAHKRAKPEEALALEKEAVLHFRIAGESYEKAAAVASNPEEGANRLWNSSLDYLEAKNQPRAIQVLNRFIETGKKDKRLSQAFYQLGEIYQTQGKDKRDKARKSPESLGVNYETQAKEKLELAKQNYNHCIEYPGRFAYRARFQLAQIFIDEPNLDHAKDILEQNLNLLVGDMDSEAHEKTLYALGHLQIERQDYRGALFRLEEAVQKYPKSPEALRARTEAAECYERLGEEEIRKLKDSLVPASRESHTRLAEENLTKAIAKYKDVENLLRERKAKRALTEEEQTLLLLSSFNEASCLRSLGIKADGPAKARKLYRDLAVEYDGQLEGIRALSWIVRCYLDEEKIKDARAVVEEIAKAVKLMPDAAFTSLVDSSSRKEWELWIEETKAEIDDLKKQP
ncbi:MAG: hypothetical protein ACJ8FY_05635 [Gemmataceae bacterium]